MRIDMAKSRRKPKNLLLDADAIARAERYGQLHGTSLSRLVGNLLRSLPLGDLARPQSPAVQRLRGVAKRIRSDRATYRQHLHRKYGK